MRSCFQQAVAIGAKPVAFLGQSLNLAIQVLGGRFVDQLVTWYGSSLEHRLKFQQGELLDHGVTRLNSMTQTQGFAFQEPMPLIITQRPPNSSTGE